jgi:hypothetical protein
MEIIMQLKKIILAGSFLGLTSLSLLANADTLDTYNYTDHDSAVVVTSGINQGKCTGTLPAPLTQYTPAGSPTDPGQSHVDWPDVGALCLFSGGVCTADIHMTRDCSDPAVAQVELTLATHTVTVVGQPLSPDYTVTTAGNVVYIKESSGKKSKA